MSAASRAYRKLSAWYRRVLQRQHRRRLPQKTLRSHFAGLEPLEPRFDAELLQGVTVLDGTVVSRPSGNWRGRLYREFKPADPVPVSTTFIPYYTWANRGRSEMTVWLPLDY